MWPKALMQLVELAPHITRLVPAADRYFQARAEGRDSQRVALEQLAEALRGDVGTMAAAHASVAETLKEQSAALAGIAMDLKAARLASDAMEDRLREMEARMSRLWTLVLAGMVVLAILAVGTLAVLLHVGQRFHG